MILLTNPIIVSEKFLSLSGNTLSSSENMPLSWQTVPDGRSCAMIATATTIHYARLSTSRHRPTSIRHSEHAKDVVWRSSSTRTHVRRNYNEYFKDWWINYYLPQLRNVWGACARSSSSSTTSSWITSVSKKAISAKDWHASARKISAIRHLVITSTGALAC